MVASGCAVASGSVVAPGCMVVSGCAVASGCAVVPGCVVASGCAVAPGCTVASGCVVASGCAAAPGCMVASGCVVASSCAVAPGCAVTSGFLVVAQHHLEHLKGSRRKEGPSVRKGLDSGSGSRKALWSPGLVAPLKPPGKISWEGHGCMLVGALGAARCLAVHLRVRGLPSECQTPWSPAPG